MSNDKTGKDGLELIRRFDSIIDNYKIKWQAEVAQECYLECLAVECGEGECATAIATKFPNLISRSKDETTKD